MAGGNPYTNLNDDGSDSGQSEDDNNKGADDNNKGADDNGKGSDQKPADWDSMDWGTGGSSDPGSIAPHPGNINQSVTDSEPVEVAESGRPLTPWIGSAPVSSNPPPFLPPIEEPPTEWVGSPASNIDPATPDWINDASPAAESEAKHEADQPPPEDQLNPVGDSPAYDGQSGEPDEQPTSDIHTDSLEYGSHVIDDDGHSQDSGMDR